MNVQYPGAGNIFNYADMEKAVDEDDKVRLPSVLLFHLDYKSEWTGLNYVASEAARAALQIFASRQQVLGELNNPIISGLSRSEQSRRSTYVEVTNAVVLYENVQVVKLEIRGEERPCLVGDMVLIDSSVSPILQRHLQEDGRFRLSARTSFSEEWGKCASIQALHTIDIQIKPVDIHWPIDESLSDKDSGGAQITAFQN